MRVLPAGGINAFAKRILDIILATLGLLVTLGPSLATCLAIKLEDGGPVFFRQVRVGLHGRLFTLLKFRSMVQPVGPRLAQQAEPDKDLITRAGRLMRASAWDELPQLLNIFRGDMSFVGPRAMPPVERVGGEDGAPVRVADLPGFELRQSVRPGLTGLAQVYAPRHAKHRQKFRFDLLYVRRRNLLLDLRLIAISVLISVRAGWSDADR